jgi:hypothetical protein
MNKEIIPNNRFNDRITSAHVPPVGRNMQKDPLFASKLKGTHKQSHQDFLDDNINDHDKRGEI